MARKKRATASATTGRSRAKTNFQPTEGHAKNYCRVAYEYAVEAAGDRKGKKHCRWVRLAAKRFLDDLKRADTKACGFGFKAWHGNDVCDFIEKLPHVQGKWDTPTIVLEPAQIFILVNLFGFRRKDSGARRFTDAYIEMARKGAKSTLAGGISLYCFTCEGEIGPEVVVAATTGEQALKVFRPLWQMVKKTKDLVEAFGLQVWGSVKYPRAVTSETNGGTIQPVNAKSETQDGWNPHVVVLDELHAHKDRGLHDVMKSAFGARKNPLMLRITTAGVNVLGVCYEQRALVTKILDGIIQADHYFGIIFTLDEGDDEFDATKWCKANPMLGVTPTLESMQSYAKEAKSSPATLGEFKTKRLNIWTTAYNNHFNIEDWKKCKHGFTPEVWELLKQHQPYGGLDLSAVSDITAWMKVWLIHGWLYISTRCYLPEDTVKPRTERGNVPYQVWAKEGHLTLTPGNVVDYEFVEKDIEADLKRFSFKELAFDDWNAGPTANRLMAKGAPMVEFRQGPKSYHPAMKAMEELIKKHQVWTDGNPVLTWAMSNVVSRHDANMNYAPDKKHSMEKIDPAIGALMALGRAIAQKADDTPVIGPDYELVVV